jgi:hypothetical protein
MQRKNWIEKGYQSDLEFRPQRDLEALQTLKSRRSFGVKLNFGSRTVAPSSSSGSLFASQIDVLCAEAKPFCFHITERANDHVKEGDTFFFTYDPIGVPYNGLPAMFTNAIHAFLKWQGTCHRRTRCPTAIESYVTTGFLPRT